MRRLKSLDEDYRIWVRVSYAQFAHGRGSYNRSGLIDGLVKGLGVLLGLWPEIDQVLKGSRPSVRPKPR